MAGDHQRIDASRQLVVALNKYTEVIELQLVGLRQTLAEAVQSVMDGITKLSNVTESESKEADQLLEKTYFAPDQNTMAFIEAVQTSVDSVFNAAQEQKEDLSSALSNRGKEAKEDQRIVDDQLRRFAGQFSKHMEALSTMDSTIAGILFKMMAALSSDDVIGQRLQHVLHAVHGLEVGLSYLLIDTKQRFNFDEVEKVKRDVLSFTFAQYTSEDEKEMFRKIFSNFK